MYLRRTHSDLPVFLAQDLVDLAILKPSAH